MKKILLMCTGMGIAFSVRAQTLPQAFEQTNENLSEAVIEQEFFPLLDMKIFHDSYIVQEMILAIHEQEQRIGRRDKLTQSVFNEKDSAVLENALDDNKITYNITPELLEKAKQDPFNAFKDLIKTAQYPAITQAEMDSLNQVDDKAISNMLQMVTESGPDIGANVVSVVYEQ